MLDYDKTLYSCEPTEKSIWLANEQKNWQPPKEKPTEKKKGKSAPAYDANVCSTNLEVYQYNLLNPNN